MTLHRRVPQLDAALASHSGRLGADMTAYRNHCYRVLNFCAALHHADPVALEKIAIAVAFHDLGIWTDATFDYLAPSRHLARDYLAATGRRAWTAEIDEMIEQHHKLTPYRGPQGAVVEAFRKADLADVSLGLPAGGLPGAFVSEVRRGFPNAGFHRLLVVLFGRRLRSHPFSPMPMMRL